MRLLDALIVGLLAITASSLLTTSTTGELIELPDHPMDITNNTEFISKLGLEERFAATEAGIINPGAPTEPVMMMLIYGLNFKFIDGNGYELAGHFNQMARCFFVKRRRNTRSVSFVDKRKYFCVGFEKDAGCFTSDPMIYMPSLYEIPDLRKYQWDRRIVAYACFWV